MSCPCTTQDPCCPAPGTPLDPAQEPLDSEVGNFVTAVYGSVTKTLSPTGQVVWTLPCDLDAGLPANPRNIGEGTFCYLLRLVRDGIEGAVGPAGPTGPAGPSGAPAYSTISTAFTQPTLGSPLFSFSLVSAAWVAPEMILFIETCGWVRVESKSGNTVLATLLVPISSPPPSVAVGAGVGPTGPQGVAAGAPDTVATPVFSPLTGAYGAAQSVTITTTTPGAVIYYTIDGSLPGVGSLVYTAPFTVADNRVVKAIGIRAGFLDSAVATATYNIRVATPVAAPAAGSYTGSQAVTLTTVTPGASIRYTVDGSTPTDVTGTLYSGPVTIAASATLKAVAFKAGMDNSTVLTQVYSITPTFLVRWGNSTSSTLNEAGILGLANSATVSSIQRSWNFGAFAAGTYQFFIIPDGQGSPRATDGFWLAPFPVDIAGATEGYNDGTQNGWSYELVTVSGVVQRVYRTKYALEGGVTIETFV